MKDSRGNLLTTFIILIAMCAAVFAFISLMAIRLQDSSVKVSETESFYVAEAGLNKAIWYLGTTVANGGNGLSWRTASVSQESFGRGVYYFTVQNTAVSDEVLIIATGEVEGIQKTISQVVLVGGLPAAFDYAIYSNAAIDMAGNAAINGDIFVNGNVNFSGSAAVNGGYVYHPAGTSVGGHGTFTDGGEPNPVPTFPTLDTSYYSGLIATAQGVTAGNKNYKNQTVDLSGATVYVKGNVDISGTVTFNGPGAVVATGTIDMSGSTYSSGGVKFIAGGAIGMSGNNYTSDAIYYSAASISASGNIRVNVGSMLSEGTTSLGGNSNISGLIYSVGQISLNGNPTIKGSLVSGALEGVTGISGSTSITFDQSVFPAQLPPGFTATDLTRKKGSWKGD